MAFILSEAKELWNGFAGDWKGYAWVICLSVPSLSIMILHALGLHKFTGCQLPNSLSSVSNVSGIRFVVAIKFLANAAIARDLSLRHMSS
jgi:hypothetical protein